MILTGKQLKTALEFIAPDENDEDQLETEAWLFEADKDFKCPETGENRKKGTYIGLYEYPEEGSIYLEP